MSVSRNEIASALRHPAIRHCLIRAGALGPAKRDPAERTLCVAVDSRPPDTLIRAKVRRVR